MAISIARLIALVSSFIAISFHARRLLQRPGWQDKMFRKANRRNRRSKRTATVVNLNTVGHQGVGNDDDSRLTSRASLSSRNAMNFECRRWWSPVHSRNSNWPTKHRLQPAAVCHLRLRQPGSPPTALALGQIRERALLRFQPTKFLHQLRAHDGREPVACPRAASENTHSSGGTSV